MPILCIVEYVSIICIVDVSILCTYHNADADDSYFNLMYLENAGVIGEAFRIHDANLIK